MNILSAQCFQIPFGIQGFSRSKIKAKHIVDYVKYIYMFGGKIRKSAKDKTLIYLVYSTNIKIFKMCHAVNLGSGVQR